MLALADQFLPGRLKDTKAFSGEPVLFFQAFFRYLLYSMCLSVLESRLN